MNSRISSGMVGNRGLYLALLSCLSVLSFFCAQASNDQACDANRMAPQFEATTIDGQKIKLSNYRGKIVLLAFIDIPALNDSDQLSETQLQCSILKSMHRQYESAGLQIILIASAGTQKNNSFERNRLINFVYDNGIETMPLVVGEKSIEITTSYKVCTLPSTFLIDGAGQINQVWEHVALSSQLGIAIKLLTERNAADLNQLWDTKLVAVFPGLAPGRQLSTRIWLVDNGAAWKKKGTPLRLVVLASNAVKVKLVAVHKTTKESKLIVDSVLEKIPEEEGRVILQNVPNKYLNVHTGFYATSLMETGQYILYASVFDAERNSLLFTGEGKITVE